MYKWKPLVLLTFIFFGYTIGSSSIIWNNSPFSYIKQKTYYNVASVKTADVCCLFAFVHKFYESCSLKNNKD